MLSKLKNLIKVTKDRMLMFKEFYLDYREYKKWNYNSPSCHSCNAYEAKILRQAHMIEKGLSLSNPRRGFGQEKINTLFNMLDDYIKKGYSVKGVPFKNAINVLHQYVEFQKSLDYVNDDICDALKKYQGYLADDFAAGIAHTTLEDMQTKIHGSFPDFFNSRHSIRQFDARPIEKADIEKAVQLAMKAPTACNRQACKVYFYSDTETNRQLGNLIAGNTGFEDEVKNYLVITADISAFYDTFERNQLYVEAGIFTLALLEALHYYGIASCVLQNGEYHSKNNKFKAICKNIPENEKIAVFVAIGYYKSEFSHAISKRKNLQDVLIYK